MDVEVLISWCKDVLEGLLVLRCGCPRRMRCWCGDHHEERLRVGLVVQEAQRDVSQNICQVVHTVVFTMLPCLPIDREGVIIVFRILFQGIPITPA